MVENPILVTGGTGTIGRRVVAQLRVAGHAVRAASRRTDPPFDWGDPGTWAGALDGVERMYLLLPDETPLPDGFLDAAEGAGVRRVVLQSDRGVEVRGAPHVEGAERAVRATALDRTVVRPDWFAQDFETFFREPVVSGRLCLPVGDARQGFVDGDDIAAVGVRALTTDGHLGETLELTGPAAFSFREACSLIAAATGRPVEFDGTPEGYRSEMRAAGLPDEVVESLVERFGRLAARGDTVPTGAVEAVVGRPARPFADYVADAAARGAWGATSAYGP
ncbi:NAD(P)H-binding protein [Actinotalea ferrariae]|nr:NAD(P)H-binding protein [Actinotalea ferrariae]